MVYLKQYVCVYVIDWDKYWIHLDQDPSMTIKDSNLDLKNNWGILEPDGRDSDHYNEIDNNNCIYVAHGKYVYNSPYILVPHLIYTPVGRSIRMSPRVSKCPHCLLLTLHTHRPNFCWHVIPF